jgi:subtilase-type serine protease
VQLRPPAGPAPHINLFDPTAIAGLTTSPSFPSGHTTYAYIDSILLGMMTPALYQSMLSRGSEFANSRIVLGVHYPLDIIASRSLASYDLSQAFTNPDCIDTAINLPSCSTRRRQSSTVFSRRAAGRPSQAARRIRPIPTRRRRPMR